MTVRYWERSASLLGDQDHEERLRQMMEKMYPRSKFPIHIGVIGTQSTKIEVHVWNDAGVDLLDWAYPEDFLASPDGAKVTAAIFKVVDLVTKAMAQR